jgi:hypothetical protein
MYPPDELFDFLLSKILAPRVRFRITSQGTIAERLHIDRMVNCKMRLSGNEGDQVHNQVQADAWSKVETYGRLLYLTNDRVAERVGFEPTETPIEISKFMKNLRLSVPCRPLHSPAFGSR